MKKPLKIGIVCYPTYGGSGVVAAELGKQLIKHEHEVHFFSYSLPIRLNSYTDKIFFHEVTWLEYPLFEHSQYSLALAAKLVEITTYYNLDIIHVHYALPHSLSAELARDILKDRNIKVVTTLHGTDVTLVGVDATFFPITKHGIEQSDAITCVSQYLADLTKEKFGITKPIYVIPNFINTQEFLPGKRVFRCPMLTKSKFNVIHISNFRPIKRVVDVVKIFELVLKEIDCCMMMVGDGTERSSAERYALEHNILDRVHFLGKQLNIVELLQSSDLLLLPSQLESFGLVALEAMSCGVPVVGTNVGGMPEVIVHGETGYLAEVGNIHKMAEYSLKILQDPDHKNALGINARNRAIDLFEADRVVLKYEELYQKLL
jgi:L-malate glycosyltransferase